jgi:hypothetical protein
VGALEHTAVVADTSFSVPAGTLALAPGSSGWRAGGRDVRWLELFLRGGSAADSFGRPTVGQSIAIEGVPAPS